MEKPRRRDARENAFLRLFAASFQMPGPVEEDSDAKEAYPLDPYMEEQLSYCIGHIDEIDEKIIPKLKGWTIDRLPRVSLAAVRLAVAEMISDGEKEDEMESIVINEAVELAKKYGADDEYQFVNGVLGSIVREKSTGSNS